MFASCQKTQVLSIEQVFQDAFDGQLMSCISYQNMQICYDGDMITVSISTFNLRRPCPNSTTQSSILLGIVTPQKVISHDGVVDLTSNETHQTAIGLFLENFVIVLDRNVELQRGKKFSHLVLMPEGLNMKDLKIQMKIFKRSPDELKHFYQERQSFIFDFKNKVGFSTLMHDSQTKISTPLNTHLFDANYNFLKENLEITVFNLDEIKTCFLKSDILETKFDTEVCIPPYS